MDTHINEADLTHAGIGLSAPLKLPGEGLAAHDQAPPDLPPGEGKAAAPNDAVPPARATARPRRRRKALLAGVTLAAILGVVGAGAYTFSDALRTGDVRHVSLRDAHLPPVVASMLASSTPRQAGPALEAGVQPPSATPRPAPVVANAATVSGPAAFATTAPAAQPKPVAAAQATNDRRMLLAEFAALKPGEPATPASAVQPEAPASARADTRPTLTATAHADDQAVSASPVPVAPSTPLAVAAHEAGIPASIGPLMPSKPAQGTVAVSPVPAPVLATRPSATASAPAAAPVAPPSDAIVTAADLRAAPMSTAQQIEVLNLVKNLAVQLRDTRIEVAQLHQTVTHLSEKVDAATTEFDNRLTMAETASAVQSSARAGAKPSEAAAETVTASAPSTPPPPVRMGGRATVPPVVMAPIAPPAPERRTVKDYVVKGASPGLAVLSALNPASGSASVIEVGVGDAVPGLGRVKRVYQRGTTWVVETENGSIQP